MNLKIILLCNLFVFKFLHGKVELSQELLEVLQRKSVLIDPENRVIVAFRTSAEEKENPMDSLRKGGHQLLEAEEYRMALGNLVATEMQNENSVLEEILLTVVDLKQIVRRLPIGNSFVLEGLTPKQATEISEMDRTVLLALSRFRATSDAAKEEEEHFIEPVQDIKEWTEVVMKPCDPLLKATCQPEIPWNIRRINTPEAWQRGFKGKGIIYGVIDTGVSFKHPFMTANYFGNRPNGVFDHNYAWFDGVQTRQRSYGVEEDLSDDDDEDDEKIDALEKEIDRKMDTARDEEQGYDEDEKGYDADDERNDEEDEEDEEDSLLDTEDEDSLLDTEEDDLLLKTTTQPPHRSPRFKHLEKNNQRPVLEKCAAGSRVPCDDAGHGTHVASTAVGGYNFGVAPEAQWMACRSFSGNTGRDEDALACLNFFLAPHDLNGKNVRPEIRPHVIGNSYGWNSWAEVVGAGIDLAVRRLEAAGTVMVFAAGNSGPKCGSIHSAFSFTVGATTAEGTLASFSSRGPWTISASWANKPSRGGPLRIKPEISAPGQSIHGAYGPLHAARLSGTSMAAPHVAGAVALLLQSCPHLIGHPVKVQNLLQRTARPMTVPVGSGRCGVDDNTTVPNNYFGAGELDIDKAIHTCTSEKKHPPGEGKQ